LPAGQESSIRPHPKKKEKKKKKEETRCALRLLGGERREGENVRKGGNAGETPASISYLGKEKHKPTTINRKKEEEDHAARVASWRKRKKKIV